MRNSGAHQYPTAIAILNSDLVGGRDVTASVTDQAGYTEAEVRPPGVTELRGVQGAWWMFRSSAHIEGSALEVYATTSGPQEDIYFDLWIADPGGWTSVASPEPDPGVFRAGTPAGFFVEANVTYYARVATRFYTTQPDVHLTASLASSLIDPAPVDPPPGPDDPPPGPEGLALISAVSDAFDENTLDAKWFSPDDTALLGNGHLTLTGTVQTTTSGYSIDSAFVKLTVPPRGPDEFGWASFVASVPFGSPPTNWGFNIFVNGSGTSQITSTWGNDDGTTGGTDTIDYDPVAHAYLRLSSTFEHVAGDWLLTMVCEAGPAPGQWTELMRTPPMYSTLVSQGFQIVFNAQNAPVWLSDFNVAPADSVLWMKMPDGVYRNVGVLGQPLQFRLPDGSVREWPGSTYPLYQKQPDGSWLKVVG